MRSGWRSSKTGPCSRCALGARIGLIIVILTAAWACGACNPFRRSKSVPVPQAPAPEVATLPAPEPPPEREPLPPPPQLEQGPVTSPPSPPQQEIKLPARPPTQPQKARRPKASPAPATKPAPPPEETPAEPAAVPQLKQLLTPEQEEEYNQGIDASLKKARTELAAIQSRRLNQEQAAALARIQAFIQQAEATRKSDPVTARNLARRAELLAEDLARSVR